MSDLYMVVVAAPDNDNLEILDYNLSEVKAQALAAYAEEIEEYENVKIVKHDKF